MSTARDFVHSLLEKTTLQKLIISDSESAIKLARRALESAKHPEVAPVLRQVAAYRLAHLLMRDDDAPTETLREVDQLLAEAAGDGDTDAIGPLPLIFQIAVLSRLESTGAIKKSEAMERRLTIYRKACNRIKFSPSAGRSLEDLVPEPFVLQAQTPALNLLELASYFLNLPYKPLLGLGAKPQGDEQLISGAWRLLSNTDLSYQRQFNQAYAEEELKWLLEREDNSIGFRLNANNRINADWSTDGTAWQPWNRDNQIHILACYLENSRIATDECILKVDPEMRNDCFRQQKVRCGKGIDRHLGLPNGTTRFADVIQRGAKPSIYVLVRGRL